MSLTATEPDPELLEGLSLDAAWEQAKALDAEVKRLRELAKSNRELWSEELTRRNKLENSIMWLVMEYESNPGQFGKSMAQVMAKLNELATGK